MKTSDQAPHRSSVILGTRQGESVLLTGNADLRSEEDSGGRIYTTADMPELEGMLLDIFNQLDVVSAVFERPAPTAVSQSESRQVEYSPDDRLRPGFWSMAVLGGIPVSTLAVGIVMMVGALGGGSAVSNPYVALLLIAGGLGLGLTSWVAIHDAYRS